MVAPCLPTAVMNVIYLVTAFGGRPACTYNANGLHLGFLTFLQALRLPVTTTPLDAFVCGTGLVVTRTGPTTCHHPHLPPLPRLHRWAKQADSLPTYLWRWIPRLLDSGSVRCFPFTGGCGDGYIGLHYAPARFAMNTWNVVPYFTPLPTLLGIRFS